MRLGGSWGGRYALGETERDEEREGEKERERESCLPHSPSHTPLTLSLSLSLSRAQLARCVRPGCLPHSPSHTTLALSGGRWGWRRRGRIGWEWRCGRRNTRALRLRASLVRSVREPFLSTLEAGLSGEYPKRAYAVLRRAYPILRRARPIGWGWRCGRRNSRALRFRAPPFRSGCEPFFSSRFRTPFARIGFEPLSRAQIVSLSFSSVFVPFFFFSFCDLLFLQVSSPSFSFSGCEPFLFFSLSLFSSIFYLCICLLFLVSSCFFFRLHPPKPIIIPLVSSCIVKVLQVV